MLAEKLEAAIEAIKEKDRESASLKEDLRDVTESLNQRMSAMQQTFETENALLLAQ